MRFTHHAKLLALGAALAGLVIVPSIGEVSTASGDPVCGPLSPDGFHEISTASQLKKVGSVGVGQGVCGLGAKYRLVAEVDLSSETNWAPIGSASAPFDGEFDGNSDDPSEPGIVGLSDMATGHNDIGLFGALGSSAVVRDLFLINFTVTPKEDVHTVGALAGRSAGNINNVVVLGSTITNGERKVSETVSSVTSGGLGGLVGQLSGSVANVFVETSRVFGAPESDPETSNSANATGGVIGLATMGSDAENVHFRGDDVRGRQYTGGITGHSRGGTITRSSAAGAIEGGSYTGGVVGENTSAGVVSFSSFVGDVLVDINNSSNIGGFVGMNRSQGLITDSSSAGTLVVLADSVEAVGGFAGSNISGGEISRSQSAIDVVTEGDSSKTFGGFLGVNQASGQVSESFSAGSLSVEGPSAQRMAGFVGMNTNQSEISNSYSVTAVQVSGIDSEWVGGFVGQNREDSNIATSYVSGVVRITGFNALNNGGFVAGNFFSGTVSASFWDRETISIETTAGGTAKSTVEMKTLETFADDGWSIAGCSKAGESSVWGILPGSYPFLTWQDDPQLSTCAGSVGPQAPDTTQRPQAQAQGQEAFSAPALGGQGSSTLRPDGSDGAQSLDGEDILPTTPEQPGESDTSTGDATAGGTLSGGSDMDSDVATTPQGMANIGWLVGIALGGVVAIALIAGGVMFARTRV